MYIFAAIAICALAGFGLGTFYSSTVIGKVHSLLGKVEALEAKVKAHEEALKKAL
jgi:hypothetical protein